MKFTEALVLGSTVLQPKAGMYLSEDNSKGCAIGMAGYAIGLRARILGPVLKDDFDTGAVQAHWPWLKQRIPSVCVCVNIPSVSNHSVTIFEFIVHMFDIHVTGHVARKNDPWSFEQLVEAIRKLEDRFDPTPASPVEEREEELVAQLV